MIDAIADLLACPICQSPLTLTGAALRCSHQHSFDVSKAGYVDLVAPVGRKAPEADTLDMVHAREDFLSGGHYRPIVDALVAALAPPPGGPPIDAFADLGSGPGYYARHVLHAIPTSRVVAADLSKAAVTRAARADPRMGAVRANVKTAVPVRDSVLDAIVVVFAPRNPGEWYRILSPTGRALVVIPTERHLEQLREVGAILDIEPGKRERLLADVDPYFEHSSTTAVEWVFHPEPADVAALIGMGPSALHGTRLTRIAADVARTLTASVELHVFTPRAVPSSDLPSVGGQGTIAS